MVQVQSLGCGIEYMNKQLLCEVFECNFIVDL